MILFGAGSSIPFDIPGMAEFTAQFIAEHKETSSFVNDIKDAISQSEEIIGISFSFDLETLLSVLNDLSGVEPKKPISITTASLLLKQSLTIKEARQKYGDDAILTLDKLKGFVFERCMQPIKKSKQNGNFRILDRFFGPLLTVLNWVDLKNVQAPVKRIYSTNWDLCFKMWADYINVPIDEMIDLDKQSFPVLNVEKGFRSSAGFEYVPLHGSLDLIKIRRLKGEGAYEDVFKIPDPLRYFEDKPDNIRDVFMIYPLEAIGYGESVKSPYFDMLDLLRSSLRRENVVFIIGYSLRDPIIGSIFEEIIAERIRNGHLAPLSEDLDSRITGVSEQQFKIIVINPEPNKLVENLKKQFNTNLLQTFIPIKIEFPKIADEKFDEKYTQVLFQLIVNLVYVRYIGTDAARNIVGLLNRKYDTRIQVRDFPWVKK